jgi:trk system potassium uptake protein
MRAVIVGAGKTGSYLAGDLAQAGHQVVLIEKDSRVVAGLGVVEGVRVMRADGCDPEKLEQADLAQADLMVALTGDDEDNLVVSWLAKYVFGVKRVIARANNPKNRWLYSSDWGVDVPFSALHIITKLIEEEARFGELVTLIKLQNGEISLVETTLISGAPAQGRRIDQLELPPDATLVAVLRQGKLIGPMGETVLTAGDQILALTSPGAEEQLVEMFASP